MVAFFTSRDPAISDTLTKAGTSAGRYPDFDEALTRHWLAWEELWRVSEVEMFGSDEVQHLRRAARRAAGSGTSRVPGCPRASGS
jgi:trehalose/maltose hydrolase-like predicted phosphorylase